MSEWYENGYCIICEEPALKQIRVGKPHCYEHHRYAMESREVRSSLDRIRVEGEFAKYKDLWDCLNEEQRYAISMLVTGIMFNFKERAELRGYNPNNLIGAAGAFEILVKLIQKGKL